MHRIIDGRHDVFPDEAIIISAPLSKHVCSKTNPKNRSAIPIDIKERSPSETCHQETQEALTGASM
jgi:hypothetical protein